MSYQRYVPLNREKLTNEIYELKMWELDLRARLEMVEENERLKARLPSLSSLIKRPVVEVKDVGGRPPKNGIVKQTPDERRAQNAEIKRRSRAELKAKKIAEPSSPVA